MTKYIFVTGGVVSGLGKGITAASLGRLLKARGLRVCLQKFDPYLNVDCGAMNPIQHGEVFITEDGAETDLDVGHYERFVDENLNIFSNITTGKVYASLINKERSGKLGSGTIQVIPHITNEIKERIYRVGKETNTDIVITEIGGTVGDIESTPFMEAIRQVAHDVGRENVLYIHVTLVPFIKISGEIKTKPTQHSVKELLSIGIQPDIIVCRTENALGSEIKDKISLFCNVAIGNVISNADCDTLYEVPLLLEQEGLAHVVCKNLGLACPEPDLEEWRAIVKRAKALMKKGSRSVNIALVGKYVELRDAYLSVAEALRHAGIYNNVNVNIDWIDSKEISQENYEDILKSADGIIVPGGYGAEGVDGMILAAKYAREKDVPFFAEGLGMQAAVIEFARNVMNIADATSHEFDEAARNPVIMNPYGEKVDLYDKTKQRLGAYPCKLTENSLAKKIYNDELIYERHHHHYEVNNGYRKQMEEAGLKISGISPNEMMVEIIENSANKFFIGVSFNPEFKSRPNRAHPLFINFIGAAMHKQ